MKIFVVIAITVALTVGGVLGLSGWLRGLMGGAQSTPLPVRVEKAERGRLVEFVTAPGLIEPKTKVSISARVAARILELPFDEGAEVSGAGPDGKTPPSLLVRLDSKDLEAELRSVRARRDAQEAQIEVNKVDIQSLQAGIRSTEVDLNKALRDLGRQEELLATGDVSQSAVDDLQATVDGLKASLDSAAQNIHAKEKGLLVAQHNLEAADADIARAADQLTYTSIYSPLDGVVTRLNTEVGELAVVGTTNNPGTVIMEVADLSQMLLIAQVSEADIGGVCVGQLARIRIQAYPDRDFTGKVTQIALTATEQPSKHYEVEVLVETNGDRIFSGLTADVDIEIAEHADVLKVPSQAVLGRAIDDLPTDLRSSEHVDRDKTIAAVVYKLVGGKTVACPVKLGASDPTHTAILGGLEPGDAVVVGPYKVLEYLGHDMEAVDETTLSERERQASMRAHAAGQFQSASPDQGGSRRGPRR